MHYYGNPRHTQSMIVYIILTEYFWKFKWKAALWLCSEHALLDLCQLCRLSCWAHKMKKPHASTEMLEINYKTPPCLIWISWMSRNRPNVLILLVLLVQVINFRQNSTKLLDLKTLDYKTSWVEILLVSFIFWRGEKAYIRIIIHPYHYCRYTYPLFDFINVDLHFFELLSANLINPGVDFTRHGSPGVFESFVIVYGVLSQQFMHLVPKSQQCKYM